VALNGAAAEDVEHVLGAFTRPWEPVAETV